MEKTTVNKSFKKWNNLDTAWALSLYGTGIGAGILFLPIQAGLGGLLPVLIMTIIAFPLTFLTHRNVARFVLAGKNASDDIIEVTKQNFNRGFTNFFASIYFFSIFPIIMIFGISLTNNVINVLVELLGWSSPSRWWIALLIVSALILLVNFGKDITIRIMSFLVFPLVGFLFLFSLAMITHWDSNILNTLSFSYASPIESHNSLFKALLLSFPVIIFAFYHMVVISAFTVSYKENYGQHAERKLSKTLSLAVVLMIITASFFLFSCVMVLEPRELLVAKTNNVSVLDYLAVYLKNPAIKYMASAVAFVAIITSFIGTYFGAQEALKYFFSNIYRPKTMTVSDKTIKIITALTVFILAWTAATYNLSIVATMVNILVPIFAFMLFIFPLIAIYTIPTLYKYKSFIPDLFIAITGITCIYIAIISLL
ncbi:amino acid permease [Bartonella sp. DGB1]|uniref:amino acid permease n=1 Tax=Bartonella sp. DGB1 TaxID=3239807 RepID=UPI003524D4E9